MYRDNSLIPNEAVRLLALGLLAEQPCRYDELAQSVRRFTGLIVGPSLDLVAPPIEILRVDGLIEVPNPDEGDLGMAVLALTEAGREEFERLMAANVRAPVNDVSRLIIAVKLRFLELLPAEERTHQTDALIEMSERQLARLRELRAKLEDRSGGLGPWLDHEARELEDRIALFESLRPAS